MQFGSDNQAGVSAPIMQAIMSANQGFADGYGTDAWTQQAEEQLKKVFACEHLKAYFVTTGTIANCLALSCLVRPWQTILAHRDSHIFLDESTGPELFSGGARVVPLPTQGSKIHANDLIAYFKTAGQSLHNAQAGALSITQSSENGLIYTPTEIQAISRVCRANGVKLHMDGARFANALVAQTPCTPAELTWQSGVDVLCLGATKGGAFCAEAVIFFDKSLAADFAYQRKRAGQLLSKGRLLGAQFLGWLTDDHWQDLAKHANAKAAQLAQQLSAIDGCRQVYLVESNQLFFIIPKRIAKQLKQGGAVFYEWYHSTLPADTTISDDETYIRMVTSFQTTEAQIDQFVALAKTP